MDFGVGGILGLVILILDVWAIINIAQSGAQTAHKALWIVLVLLLPLVGLIIWALLGPRSSRI